MVKITKRGKKTAATVAGASVPAKPGIRRQLNVGGYAGKRSSTEISTVQSRPMRFTDPSVRDIVKGGTIGMSPLAGFHLSRTNQTRKKEIDKLAHHLVTQTHGFTDWPADDVTRVALIRHGMPSTFVYAMSDALRMPKDQLYITLALPRSTIERKIKDKALLSADHTERLLGLQSIIETAQRIVQESGEPDGFNAAEWVGEWIQQPQPALGGAKPAEVLDTVTGQRLVEALLERAQSGAYA